MMTELEVLKAVCDNLVYLGDHKYQKRVWISGLGPEVSSYEDSYEDFLALILSSYLPKQVMNY